MTLRIDPAAIVEASTSRLLGKHESWARVRLGEVADIVNGCAFPSARFNTSANGMPLIRIRDVGENRVSTWYEGPFEDRYVVNPGAVLLGMDGDFRIARWQGPAGLLNQRVCRIALTRGDVLDEAFMLYAMPAYLDAINEHTSSVTVKHLSSETVKGIPLPLPPLEEQRRIVEAIEERFSRLDAAEADVERVEYRARVLAEAAYRTVLSPAWPSAKLATIAKTSSGGTPSRRKTENFGGAIPWVKSGELGDSHVRATSECISDRGLASSNTKLLKRGTLMIAMYGATVGKLGILDMDSAATNQAVCAIEPYDPDLTPFLWLCLRAMRRRLINSAKGGAQPNISQGMIRDLMIPLPPPEERIRLISEIAGQATACECVIVATLKARTQSRQLRRAILELAFSGELAPQSGHGEPLSLPSPALSGGRGGQSVTVLPDRARSKART